MSKKQLTLPRLAPDSFLIDTHCHLDMEPYAGDQEAVVRSAAAAGVTGIVTVGIDPASSRQAVALARRFPRVWATVGIHPHHAGEAGAPDYQGLANLAANRANKVVGYGEIGLDYAKTYAPIPAQQRVFRDQLGLARELGLPLIIHDRDAHADTLRLLRAEGPYPAGGVMHCFSGDIDFAREVLELGFHISIPGIVTFAKSAMLQEVARQIPLERMLLETDGPFLAPVPFRGRNNYPEYLLYTARKVAELRNISLDEVARQTSRNAARLFGLQPEGGNR
jgi:TatD DNase family protein